MAVDVSTFRAFLPEFASTSEDTINVYIQQAGFRVSAECLGVHYDAALMYMVGHMLTVALQGGAAAGGIRAESVGSLSRQFGGASLTSKTNLDSTAYGKEYLALVKLSCRGGYAIGTSANCGRY